MPDLRCTVQTCTHNKNFYCDLDGIVVGGNSYSNVTGEASPTSKIDCKATDCMYNDECKCHAGKISVEGGDACHCEQTECATFKCGCQ